MPENFILPYQLIVMSLCVYVVLKTEPLIGNMRKETPLHIRFSVWVVLVGSLVQVLAILKGNPPDTSFTILLLGVAFFLNSDKQCKLKNEVKDNTSGNKAY